MELKDELKKVIKAFGEEIDMGPDKPGCPLCGHEHRAHIPQEEDIDAFIEKLIPVIKDYCKQEYP